MANIMESLAALKGLAFVVAAGCYLLWRRWRRKKEQLITDQISFGKEKLDVLLFETVEVERLLATTQNPGDLQELLDRVIQVKLKALDELTHKSLRGDRVFLIFLTQSSNLINFIQQKINHCNSKAH